jgi:hypothetical protein
MKLKWCELFSFWHFFSFSSRITVTIYIIEVGWQTLSEAFTHPPPNYSFFLSDINILISSLTPNRQTMLNQLWIKVYKLIQRWINVYLTPYTYVFGKVLLEIVRNCKICNFLHNGVPYFNQLLQLLRIKMNLVIMLLIYFRCIRIKCYVWLVKLKNNTDQIYLILSNIDSRDQNSQGPLYEK